MRYYIHFTYDRHDNNRRLWLAQHIYADSQANAEEKARRLMSEFKNAKLSKLELRLNE